MLLPPAIVLAGGLGTRLSSVISDVPKPMAPVNGRPFLEILLDHIASQGVSRLIFSVSHKREIIERHFGTAFRGMALEYCIEDPPLGTGGGIRKAMTEHEAETAFVFNGDSYCPALLGPLLRLHREREAQLTLVLSQVEDAGRFGSVELGGDGRVVAFREKQSVGGAGLINAGVYVVERTLFAHGPPQARFSFETDMMQRLFVSVPMFGHATDAMFIDIGIPSELARAQALFA